MMNFNILKNIILDVKNFSFIQNNFSEAAK